MNKYQEAIHRISLNYGLSALYGETGEIRDKIFIADIEVLQELVDKTVSIVPVKKNYLYRSTR